MKRVERVRGALLACAALWLAAATVPASALTLEQAIAAAQDNDPWLSGSQFREEALLAQSVAAGSFPDPMVSVGLANLPTDTFDFDQEAMTQFKVGISQVFPRGESRDLQQKRLQLLGQEHPHQRADRRAQVALQVSLLWLETYRASASIALIERDRDLFEQLLEVAEASYTSALGRTRQQDLIRAQLELTRLDERLSRLRETADTGRSRLLEWLSPNLPVEDGTAALGSTLPAITPVGKAVSGSDGRVSREQLGRYLSRHPAVLAQDQRIAATATDVELAEQGYRPQWRLDASYGYRDDDPIMGDRADFFSVAVAFDLPLFTERRQDQGVRSATAAVEAGRTERALLLRRLHASFETQRARLARLEERRLLYRERLLREMSEQAEASLAAYTNDDGDFAEVVRARIAELNANIEALDIDVQRLQAICQLNYLLAGEEIEA